MSLWHQFEEGFDFLVVLDFFLATIKAHSPITAMGKNARSNGTGAKKVGLPAI